MLWAPKNEVAGHVMSSQELGGWSCYGLPRVRWLVMSWAPKSEVAGHVMGSQE